MSYRSPNRARRRLVGIVAFGLVVGAGLAGFSAEAGAQWGYGGWNRGYYVPRQMAPVRTPRRAPTARMLHQKWELPKQIGTIVQRPPDGAIARKIFTETYFCHGPDFYIQMKDGFMVAVPPIGGTMNRAPLGAARMQHGGREYFYYNGVFVTKGPEGFEVVPSPVGAIVHRIPPVYRTVKTGGKTYKVVTGTYFKRVFRAGNVAYQVVAPPVTPEEKRPVKAPGKAPPQASSSPGKAPG